VSVPRRSVSRTAINDDEEEGVLAAARAIRPYLGELVGAHASGGLDARLAALLNGTIDTETVGELRKLLEQADDTTDWFLSEVLADAPRYRPPYQQPRYLRSRGMVSPAGDPTSPISAPRYSCPRGGDYVWYRPDIGTPIPLCPTHQVGLTRD
jgi:hypothetical protein